MTEEIELMFGGKSHQVGNHECAACPEGFPEQHDCGGLIHAGVGREGSKVRSTECDRCHETDLIIEVGEQPPRPAPRFDDPGSVFCDKNIDYCLEKFRDFVCHPNSSIATSLAEFGWERVVDGLRDLEAKARRFGVNPENSQFPTALHAAMELQQYLSKQKCSITSEMAARIYLQSLEHDLDELRAWERDLDSSGPELERSA